MAPSIPWQWCRPQIYDTVVLVSSLKNHGNTKPSSLSVIPSRPRDARPCRGIYAERFCLYFSSLRVDLSTRSRRLGPCSLSRDDKSCSNPVAECVTDILRYDTSARSARHDSFPIGVVMTPDTVLIVIVLAVAATLQIAGLVYIANQNRKMNDQTTADDASIYLQGRQVQQILREMR